MKDFDVLESEPVMSLFQGILDSSFLIFREDKESSYATASFYF